ncbi:PhoPQ-regulated protein [Burkholderia sp. MS455]|nr:PhoPQ-regulated protein [Burkholderia sp. MS455]
MWRYRWLLCIIVVAQALVACSRHVGGGADGYDGDRAASANALSLYKKALEAEPLRYTMENEQFAAGVERRSYRLVSQSWSPNHQVTPADWIHNVDLYIPERAASGRALVVVNNGIRYPGPADRITPDFSGESLASIAQKTKVVVISVSDIPNQRLTYSGDGIPRIEDESVARSWRLFMEASGQRAVSPIELPMAGAVSRAMSLAQRELPTLGLAHFAVSGLSKRAWATWLVAAEDSRVDAIVPFAMDLLDMQSALQHIYQSYGHHWPIAFAPYYRDRIHEHLGKPEFDQLARIIDPLQYFSGLMSHKRKVTEYIINASGDDFFVPDGATLYLDKLSGSPALRMVPNVSHAGVRVPAVEALSAFVMRYRSEKPMPVLRATLDQRDVEINLSLDETPQQLKLWAATNGNARDFRYACGVRYTPTSLRLPKGSGPVSVKVPVAIPPLGWSAYFVEATMNDGVVVTSPAYVLGKQEYPTDAPPVSGPACRTLPDSGQGDEK